jgi:hypothetical protein
MVRARSVVIHHLSDTQSTPEGDGGAMGMQHHELEVVTILQGARDGIWMGKREGYVRTCFLGGDVGRLRDSLGVYVLDHYTCFPN